MHYPMDKLSSNNFSVSLLLLLYNPHKHTVSLCHYAGVVVSPHFLPVLPFLLLWSHVLLLMYP